MQTQLTSTDITKFPLVYLNLVKVYILNSQTTLSDCIHLFTKSTKELDMSNQSQWYEKLGEVATEFATFCISVNKPVKGISPMIKAIRKVQ